MGHNSGKKVGIFKSLLGNLLIIQSKHTKFQGRSSSTFWNILVTKIIIIIEQGA